MRGNCDCRSEYNDCDICEKYSKAEKAIGELYSLVEYGLRDQDVDDLAAPMLRLHGMLTWRLNQKQDVKQTHERILPGQLIWPAGMGHLPGVAHDPCGEISHGTPPTIKEIETLEPFGVGVSTLSDKEYWMEHGMCPKCRPVEGEIITTNGLFTCVKCNWNSSKIQDCKE